MEDWVGGRAEGGGGSGAEGSVEAWKGGRRKWGELTEEQRRKFEALRTWL